MSRLEIDAGALALAGETADESVVPLGVLVDLHPGISVSMHELTLEAALRHWQRDVGAVTRGGFVEWLGANQAWLPGWTVESLTGHSLHKLSVAYRHADGSNTDEKEKTA